MTTTRTDPFYSGYQAAMGDIANILAGVTSYAVVLADYESSERVARWVLDNCGQIPLDVRKTIEALYIH